MGWRFTTHAKMPAKKISEGTPGEPVIVSNDEYSATITISSGSGSHETTEEFSDDIKLIIITPTTATTSYKYEITETTSGRRVDKSGIAFTGEHVVIKNYAMFEDSLTISITNASVDEDFTVRIRHA